MATAARKFHIHIPILPYNSPLKMQGQKKKEESQRRRQKIGNLTFDVFYETCSNNILGNLF